MKILGRSDRVDMPELGLTNIHAKIDTGAYTCSLHCSRAELVDGKLEFVLLDEEHPEFTGMKFIFKKFVRRAIKNSSGEAEQRYVIRTTIRIHNRVIRAEFSLSDRDKLRFDGTIRSLQNDRAGLFSVEVAADVSWVVLKPILWPTRFSQFALM